jgi:hypothetical protein
MTEVKIGQIWSYSALGIPAREYRIEAINGNEVALHNMKTNRPSADDYPLERLENGDMWELVVSSQPPETPETEIEYIEI